MSDFLAKFVAGAAPKTGSREGRHPSDGPTSWSRPGPVSKELPTVTVKVKLGKRDETIQVAPLKKTGTCFMNKSVMFYGPSGSGKTTLIKDFMWLARSVYPMVFIFAPTNQEKHDYDAIVPLPMVYEEFSVEDIKRLYKRQQVAASIYNYANNEEVLAQLFRRVATGAARHTEAQITAIRKKKLAEIERTIADPGAKKREEEKLRNQCKDHLIKLYKDTITVNRKRLEQLKNLTKPEVSALTYLNFNPRILTLFDDATAEILALIKEGKKEAKKAAQMEGGKVEGDVVSSFFFKGRWDYITHWYAMHDDSGLDVPIRKNAFYNVFCHQQVALAYFQRGANSFSPAEKKRAEAIINTIFNEATMGTKHAKLIYAREEGRFYYVIAEDRGDFTMCSKPLRDFCARVETSGQHFDTDNPFFRSFMEG